MAIGAADWSKPAKGKEGGAWNDMVYCGEYNVILLYGKVQYGM